MSSKINQLLQQWRPGTVGTLRWMKRRGVDRRLADKYLRSGWLERFGHGAYKRAGDTVDWAGAVYALQNQLDLDLHPGGMTAIELRGYAHYLAFGQRQVFLFGGLGTRLPAWFEGHRWSRPVTLVTTGVFSGNVRTTSLLQVDQVELDVATLEQAAFEMVYLLPKRQSYEEAVQVIESITSPRPQLIQQLLENCSSVKTKRLFMHAAERSKHPWLKRLDLSKVDFGSGRRTIHPGGRLDSKYDLVVDDPVQA